jgi:Arc/MetJ-type ribon-helix-helix transcriptional regulator
LSPPDRRAYAARKLLAIRDEILSRARRKGTYVNRSEVLREQHLYWAQVALDVARVLDEAAAEDYLQKRPPSPAIILLRARAARSLCKPELTLVKSDVEAPP